MPDDSTKTLGANEPNTVDSVGDSSSAIEGTASAGTIIAPSSADVTPAPEVKRIAVQDQSDEPAPVAEASTLTPVPAPIDNEPTSIPAPPPAPLPPSPAPPEAPEPAVAEAKSSLPDIGKVPQFGELQPKVDSHPLFSGVSAPPPKKPHKLLRRTSLLLVCLLVILVALYLVIDAGLVRGASHLPFHIFKQDTVAIAPTITPTQTAKTTTDPYAGWHTYASNSLNFKFQYPSNWTVQQSPHPLAACSGSLYTVIKAPDSEVKDAAKALNDTNYSAFVVSLNNVTSSTTQCPTGGITDYTGTPAAAASNTIGKGLLKSDSISWLGSDINNDGKTSLSTLTTSAYTKDQKLSEKGTVSLGGKDYQISLVLTGDNTADTYLPSQFVGTQLYTNSLAILESFASQ